MEVLLEDLVGSGPFPVYVASCAVALCLTPILRTLVLRTPRFRPHPAGAASIPSFGGLAILTAAILFFPSSLPTGLIVGAAGMALVGFLDDLHALSPYRKLILQATVIAVALSLGFRARVFGFDVADALLTGVWLLLITNAFNVLDMMDGLAAGVGVIASLFLAGLGLMGGAPQLSLAAASLAGGLGGFLVYNFHPAKVYMGDTGSLFSGFVLGGLAAELTRVFPSPQGQLGPLLVLGIPCFEAGFVSLARFKSGKSILAASPDHVADQLRKSGRSIRAAVTRIYLACGILGGLGLLGAFGSAEFSGGIFFAAILAGVVSGTHLLGVDGGRRRSPSQVDADIFSKNWAVHRVMRRTMEGLTHEASGALLDIGCGGMPYKEIFSSKVSRYVGVDRDRSRTPVRGIDACGDALALPIRGQAFETVICSQVLEHLPEPDRAMVEITRVLKPGGLLILTAPHIWGIHEEPNDYYRYTGYGLRYLANKAGLDVIEVRAMAGYWMTAGSRFCYYLEHFERGPFILPVRVCYLLVQVSALLLDRLHRVESDAWNYLMLARKRI